MQAPSSGDQAGKAGASDAASLQLASKGHAHSASLTGATPTQSPRPRLFFDIQELVLPTVPLGIATTATFHIRSEGYGRLELRYETTMDATRAPVTIRLPEGATLGVSRPILPVEVTFLSKKPVSFTMQLNFFDVEGNKFVMPIAGTSDNSVLTLQTYLDSRPGRFDIAPLNAAPHESRSHHASSTTVAAAAVAPTSRVLMLTELTEEQARRPLPRAQKAIYQGLEALSRPRTGFDFDNDGDPDEHEQHDLGDDILPADRQNSAGSGTRAMGEEVSRLTPINMLRQNAGGDSLFSHTLESVLAYLNASNLLNSGEEEVDGIDSPPVEPSEGARRTSSAVSMRSMRRSVPASADGDRNAAKKSPRVPLSISFDLFPSSLIQTQGKIIRTLVRNLSGLSVPTQASKKAQSFGQREKNQTTIIMTTTLSSPTSPTQAARTSSALGSTGEYLPAIATANKNDELIYTIYLDYEELLIFMKAQGCLLGGIQPWHLLSWNQLLRLLNSTTTGFTALGVTATMSQVEVQARQRGLEKDFPGLSRTAWLTLLIQLIKVFILSRVTPNHFKHLPGMSTDLACMSYNFAASNVYSVGESILLEWLNHHYNRASPLAPRLIVDFQKQLSDGLVLAGVLQSHVPNLQSLSHLCTRIVTTDDCMYNANKVLIALKDLGLSYGVTATQLVNAHMRDMVLFVLFLYQRLPNYVPRTTLEFEGALAEDMVKCIELSNPSSKPITYSVQLEGSKDFKIESYSVKLAPRGKPGSTAKFPVRFKARFSRPVDARLIFTSSDEGGLSQASASTLVFILKSHVLSRTPVATYNAQTRVYETSIVDVRVTNPFATDCTLKVTVLLDLEPSASGAKNASSGPKGDAIAAFVRQQQQSSIEALEKRAGASTTRSNGSTRSAPGTAEPQPPPIFCPDERIKLLAGETVSLPVHFLPMRMGAYRAQLILLDDACGEFMIEVHGTATAPPPSELWKWHTHSKASESKEVLLNFKNLGLDLARAATVERIRGQQKDVKKSKHEKHVHRSRTEAVPTGPAAVHYNIVSTSPFFQVPPSVLLHDVKPDQKAEAKKVQIKSKSGLPMAVVDLTSQHERQEDASVTAGADTPLPTSPSHTAAYLAAKVQPENQLNNRLAILFNPRGAGVYNSTIILTSLVDVRAYAVEVTVLADESSPMLEFRVPARQTVTQDIPIRNASQDIWNLKATLNGKNFSGPADVIVFPNTVGAYPLSFTPAWVCELPGTLSLYNTKTEEKFSYELRGLGDEPLAERHVRIDAPARSTVEHKLAVSNTSKTDIYYSVECDLATFVGPTTFRIGAGETTDYVFQLSPTASGALFGSITFREASGRFQWFGLEVAVSAPAAEDDVHITTVCRKVSTVAIPITNPTDEPLSLEVALEGVGLFGLKHLALEANETRNYEFLFAPLLPVEKTDASLSFSSEVLGEFWYRLILVATPPDEETLLFGGVEVGSSKTLDVLIENPTDEEISLKSLSTNQRNFTTKPLAFTIAPLSSQTVQLQYTPSTIGEDQEAAISFKHPVVGDWIYHVSGTGTRPSEMPTTHIASPVGSRISRTISFRNPFAEKLRIDIDILEQSNHGAPVDPAAPPMPGVSNATFQLFLKHTQGLVLAPFSSLQIPFIFAPGVIADHRALLRVSAPEAQLTWSFPLLGIAEGQTSDHPIVLQTAAREPLTEVRELRLQGLPALQSPESFSLSLEAPEEVAATLNAALHVELENPQLTSASQPLRVHLELSPLIPFKTHAFLVVSKASGGRWRFPLDLTVESPEPDDTIRIESVVNSTSSVAFRLKNVRPHAVPFTASLTMESSSTFHVWPRSGVLASPDTDAGAEGTQFIVSFSPVEFGRPLQGALHIQTASMLYVYALVGTHPRYEPPVVQSNLDNRNSRYDALSALASAQNTSRNLIASNARAAKDAPTIASRMAKVKAWRGGSGGMTTGFPPINSK